MLTKNKKTMKFGILLGAALLLFVVGFLLSASGIKVLDVT